MKWLRDRGLTEIGGFGICHSDDLLLIDDVELVRQTCSAVTVAFDDASVADYFDGQIDAGLRPEQFGRIWVHTHPGESAQPSGTDEATFTRVFGNCQWALMFILAAGGQVYARLQWNVGPRGCLELPVEVDFSRPIAGSDEDAWEAEYVVNVHPETLAHSLADSDDFLGARDEPPTWWQREWSPGFKPLDDAPRGDSTSAFGTRAKNGLRENFQIFGTHPTFQSALVSSGRIVFTYRIAFAKLLTCPILARKRMKNRPTLSLSRCFWPTSDGSTAIS